VFQKVGEKRKSQLLTERSWDRERKRVQPSKKRRVKKLRKNGKGKRNMNSGGIRPPASSCPKGNKGIKTLEWNPVRGPLEEKDGGKFNVNERVE